MENANSFIHLLFQAISETVPEDSSANISGRGSLIKFKHAGYGLNDEDVAALLGVE